MGSYQTEVLLYSLAVGLFIYFTWWILCFSSLAKSDSESVQVAPQNYTFRIRFNRSPTDAIECAENEIQLPSTTGGISVALRNTKPDQSIKEAEHLAIYGSGYPTAAEAQVASCSLEQALMVTLARIRVGADFGDRAAKGFFTPEGLKWMEQQHGQRILNNVHGIMTYESSPAPRFVLTNTKMLRGASTESFITFLKSAVASEISLTQQDRIAFNLFNASFFQPTADSRFLLLVMAIEALIEPAPRSTAAQQHVKDLIIATKASAIPSGRNALR